MIEATVCFLLRGDPPYEILLGRKKTGLGKGKYLGIGGKIEPRESMQSAAVRELSEEIGVSVREVDLILAAQLVFRFPNNPDWEQTVHAFLVKEWEGDPLPSDEMEPKWFRFNEIPYDEMWDDGRYFMPKIIQGEMFKATFEYQPDNATVGAVEYSDLP